MLVILPPRLSAELRLVAAEDLNSVICAHGVLISTRSFRSKAGRKCGENPPLFFPFGS